MRRIFFCFCPLLVSACVSSQDTPNDQFFNTLSELCGQSFQGQVISNDPQDADWAKETLTMHVRDCSATDIKIPLHVGENRSRTWIVFRTDSGLRLKHDHRHEDGTPDAVTMYGGDTAETGTATQQAFPVDDFSIAMFEREGLAASVQNTWTITLDPGESFTYALSRPNREFRAKFDLTNPVETPPPVWGYTPD